MDLGTVQQRYDAGQYASVLELAADVELIWDAAFAYNPPVRRRPERLMWMPYMADGGARVGWPASRADGRR